jgi:hypothetical protein
VTELHLLGDIATALHHSALRGAIPVIGYVDDKGAPSLSFRASTQVVDDTTIAVWARKQDAGLAVAVAARPAVSVLFFAPTEGPILLSFRGRGRAAPELDDVVYAEMIERERGSDPERKGVTVAVDVDIVEGRLNGEFFRMDRG